MKYTHNWKYKKWENEMKNSPYDTDYSLRSYINLEIYPEDIEILMSVLMPKIFEIDGLIFFDIDGESESYIRKMYSHKDTIKRSESERQKDWNSVNVGNIFFNNQDNSSEETLMNVAKLIKHNWEYYLLTKYSNKKFIVEIYGDDFEPWISFYQTKN